MKTRNICNSESGARPRHSWDDAMTPATKVPWPSPSSSVCSFVQSVRSFIRRKCGWECARPVSKTATLMPAPEKYIQDKY